MQKSKSHDWSWLTPDSYRKLRDEFLRGADLRRLDRRARAAEDRFHDFLLKKAGL